MEGVRDFGHTLLPCSWLQIMENAVDPHHVEWLHGNYFRFLGETKGFVAPPAVPEAPRQDRLRRLRPRHRQAAHPRGPERGERRLEDRTPARVPLPDVGGWQRAVPDADPGAGRRHTPPGSVLYTVHAADRYRAAAAGRGPVDYEFPWQDEHGQHIVDYIEGQDIMAWVTQGAITDRTAEHLGTSDIGVTMLRRMFKREHGRGGGRPRPDRGDVREPHERIELPLERDKFGAGYAFATAWIDQGSMRYSPQADDLRRLHIAAAAARGEKVPEEVES
jgi:5,5'-dehydrodivanillate O-demethylase oxygenase subunit